MKTNLIKTIACVLLVGLFCGCTKFTVDNRGYDESVTFSMDGGEQVITGEKAFTHICIGDGEGREIVSEDIDDTMVASFEWLTVKSRIDSKELILIAEPSTEKSRKLYVWGYYGREYAEIEVKQE